MHMSIAIVVDADDEDEALQTARGTLENYFLGEGGFFDYDRDITVDGKLVHTPMAFDSPGLDVILSNLFATQVRDFTDSCDKLRKIMAENHNDVLYDGETGVSSELWYNCHMISSRCGGAFRVYDRDGEPFHYMDEVKKFARNNPTNVYVYLRDVHY